MGDKSLQSGTATHGVSDERQELEDVGESFAELVIATDVDDGIHDRVRHRDRVTAPPGTPARAPVRPSSSSLEPLSSHQTW